MKIADIKKLTTVGGWVDFVAKITEIKELKQRTKSQMSKTPGQLYHSQKLIVIDETEKIAVWANADKQFLPNQILAFHGRIKEWQGVRFIDYAEAKSLPASQNNQQAIQQAPQGRQQASRPTNSHQAEPDYSTRISIERQTAWRGACDVCKGTAALNSDIVKLAQAGAYFIATGFNLDDKKQVEQREEELANDLTEEPNPDDIPF